jgi:hypothetical protein
MVARQIVISRFYQQLTFVRKRLALARKVETYQAEYAIR